LFFAEDFFVFVRGVPWPFLPEALGESDVDDFRLARRFIHPVKGRFRVCRSFAMSVSNFAKTLQTARMQ
jgi:hypothetical protein